MVVRTRSDSHTCFTSRKKYPVFNCISNARGNYKMLTYLPSRLIVMQVHLTASVSLNFANIEKFSRKPYSEIYIDTAASPFPRLLKCAKRWVWKKRGRWEKFDKFVVIVYLRFSLSANSPDPDNCSDAYTLDRNRILRYFLGYMLRRSSTRCQR